jgi:DNA polymerase
MILKDKLEALYQCHKKCTACPLSTQGRTQVVFGRGNPQSFLLLVGEAPGRDEDLLGKPFVGRSGILLTTLLRNAGLTEHDYYITNVVKCRPPENRLPLPHEIATCKPRILDKEIMLIRPKIIGTLGTCALRALMPEFSLTPITSLHGKPITYQKTIIFPLYHPAYALRNKQALKELEQDIQTLTKLLKK